MIKIEIGKKYITVSGGVVNCVELTNARVIIRNVYGGGCILDRKWAENNWKSVGPQRLPVVGEIWVGKNSRLPSKILDIDDGYVYSRHKDVLCRNPIEVFLHDWSPPRHAPEEVYVNVYESIDKSPCTATFFSKEKAETYKAAIHLTIKETAVRYVRAD